LQGPATTSRGWINVEASLGGKWLDLLKEVAPNVTHAAIMFNPDTAPAMCYLEGKASSAKRG
jgi:putative tryptophan/tyrosine transport system substrate-binding protein